MPIRNPQEKGLRRSWTRRHGVDEFPQAGGIDKEGTPADVAPQDFRHLENIRWRDPSIVSRGGQTALLDPGQELDGCVMGLAEVSESLALWLGSNDITKRLDRYYADTTPDYLSPAIAVGETKPQFMQVNGAGPRRGILAFAERLLQYSFDDGSVFQVSVPSRDTPVSDMAAATKNVRLFDVTEMSTWVYKYERDVNEDSATFGALIPVLYIGTETTGEVWRWDGSNLTLDTPAPLGGTGRIILAVWLGDIVACRTHYVVARNFGPWDRIIPINAAVTSFTPTCGKEYAGTVFFGGKDVGFIPTDAAMLIYYDPATNEMFPHVPSNGAFLGTIVYDLEVHQELLYFAWSESGHPSLSGHIGTVDALLTWDDSIKEFVDDIEVTFGAMLSTGDDLWATIAYEDGGHQDLIHMGNTTWPVAHVINSGSTELAPADLVAF